ncbi:trafficking protein particle complex subunit 8 isoform X2 [Zootermopsis nevadensis]|uniref:trafficking protein particle complex subunit 8 isoform X2 n=1 Tax=Zootermopsis nevadensis TaxID=136037 RepID=UPI000B8EDC94|nr:trafficking protein particle complex subunit 8 isoform X2 [Zootermopsis nevadensis]
MAQCKLTPHEFIQNAFSPMVAVMCSQLVDQTCQKNNLSFVEMIQPFCKLSTEAHFREPSGTSVAVRNLRVTMLDVNSRPPQATLARKLLNESVSLSGSDRNTSQQIGGQTVDIPASVPWFEAWRETFLQVQFPSDHEFTKHYIACILVVSSAENNPVETVQHMGLQLQQLQNITPAKLPKWFGPGVLRYYVLVHDAVDGDNDKAETTFNVLKQTYGDNNCYFLQMNSRPPGQSEDQNHLPDPWSQFLIRQVDNQEANDQDSSPRTPAEIGGVTGMPTHVITDGSCDGETSEVNNVLRPGVGPVIMSALEVAQEAGENAAPITVEHHPLSPDADPQNFVLASSDKNHVPNNDVISATSHINANVWVGQGNQTSTATQHGAYLTTSDLDHLRMLVQEFCVKALLPHVEKQIQQLNDLISNKKGVSRSFLSATKRWFGSNKPGMPGSSTQVNAVIYSSDAPELQLRRLGDLYFMFGDYSLAFQAYHAAKRDFNADQAWLYYAGALEMAALSAFMRGEVTQKAQGYMDEGIITYLNSCKMPQFATRATLLSTECLKGLSLYGEAAKQFIRMTSEDSDLRSALLLEQASYCFLKATRPHMMRKYAFHIVLAGHRFSKAGQRRHSLRCYKQAYQVYENKNWSLAEDHIHFTIGRQAANLKQISEAAKAFAHLLTPSSRQSATQQAAFLREFLTTQQQLNTEERSLGNALPVLPLPLVDGSAIQVLLGSLPPLPFQDGASNVIPATGITFSDVTMGETDIRWSKLEELLVAEAQGLLPMIFKPTVQLYSSTTNNTTRPTGIVGEPVTVCVMLQNPLHISLPLHDVHLLWRFKKSSEVTSQLIDNEMVPETADGPVLTQHLESVVLKPDCIQEVILCVTPRSEGEMQILGIAYQMSNSAAQQCAEPSNITQHTISVPGKQVFTLRKPIPKVRGSQDLHDRRLEISVVKSAPLLQVIFRDLNSEMLCGELQRVTLEFQNTGNAALTALYVASTTPELFSLGQPLPQQPGVHQVTHVVAHLFPGQTHAVPMWLRAPDTKGITSIEMLFYYENANSNSNPRYRLVRHSWQLTVLSSIQLTTTALRSSAAVWNGMQEILNFTLCVKNCNQVHDQLMTEISLLQISLASQVWQLSKNVVVPEDVRLQAQEMVHFVAVAQRQEEDGAKRNIFSDVTLNQNRKATGSLSESPYIDFFNRHFAGSTKISADGPDMSAYLPDPSVSNTGSEINKDSSVKDMDAALKVEATIILRWKACVTDGGGKKRSAIGQHHLVVEKIGTPITWPLEPTGPLQQQELMGPLRIFHPHDTSSNSPGASEKYAPIEILQKLVTYNVWHASQVIHDFKKSRLCVTPVMLTLQNCSDRCLVVKVNTLGNSSSASAANKNQLYSPHSSSSFRWVGLAGTWLELGPHTSGKIYLSAAIGSPGTYDLGSRLEVLCRSPGAPEADAVSQRWHIESAFVVSSAPSSGL